MKKAPARRKMKPKGPNRHVLARQDVRRHQMVGVEEHREQQEIEVRAMARHQHDRMSLGVLGHLLETRGLDRYEEAPEQRGDDDVQHREEGRVHVRRDLAEHLLGVGPRGLGGTTALVRALLDRGAHARRREDHLLDLVARPQRRPFDDLLLAEQEDEDRAAHLAHDGRLALRAALLHEPGEIDRLGDLDREVVVVDEERTHLRDVGRPRRCAVGEIQEAALGARSRAPEQRDRHHRDGCLAVPRRAPRLPRAHRGRSVRPSRRGGGRATTNSAARCAGTRRAKSRVGSARARDRARIPRASRAGGGSARRRPTNACQSGW